MECWAGRAAGRCRLLIFNTREARVGLALLDLQARASDPMSQPGWVSRRVAKLEFVDTRAVRWRVSVDFVVPEDAPCISLGDETFRLIPITSLAKTDLVDFDLRDEHSDALWMPTPLETTRRIASALLYWAAQDLRLDPGELPLALVHDLERVVAEDRRELESRPSALLAAAALIDASRRHRRAKRTFEAATRVAAVQLDGARLRRLRRRYDIRRQVKRAEHELTRAEFVRREARRSWSGIEEGIRPLAYRLMASTIFRSRVEETAANFPVYVAVKSATGARRIIKLAYESQIRFARPRGRFHRVLQSLGWRCWQADVLAGGRGGNYHLEVTAPPGVDVVGIAADPVRADVTAPEIRWWRRLPAKEWWRRLIFWDPAATVSVPGYSPHVHISPPDSAIIRYRLGIFLRVSRTGWLTISWLVAVAIAAAMVAADIGLPGLYSTSTTRSAGAQAGTAATLLLTLLGLIAAASTRPHPLAARLLLLARSLILIDVTVMLIGTGVLAFHPGPNAPRTLWTALTAITVAVAAMFTLSRVLPVARTSWR